MTAETFDPSELSATPLALSPDAEKHIAAQIQQTGRRHIRLGVKESGCNGFMYTLDYIDEPETDEQVCFSAKDETWQLFVRPQDLAFVRGTEITLEISGLNRALRFQNPNADSHCGCGESFSIAS